MLTGSLDFQKSKKSPNKKLPTASHQSSYYRIKWYGGRGRFDINQGLAAALRAPPSGLFIALVIQVPAGTALAAGASVNHSYSFFEERTPTDNSWKSHYSSFAPVPVAVLF